MADKDKKQAKPERQTITAADIAQISATQIAPLEATSEPRIVAAAATFTGHGGIATTSRAAAIEAAMSDAVMRALADGVSIEDSDTIKKYKEHARQQVKAALDRSR